MPDWQPMTTAPLDGDEIVVLSRSGPWIVSWQGTGWRIKAMPGRDPITYLHDALAWMPLPGQPTYAR